jgi:ribonuclease HI
MESLTFDQNMRRLLLSSDYGDGLKQVLDEYNPTESTPTGDIFTRLHFFFLSLRAPPPQVEEEVEEEFELPPPPPVSMFKLGGQPPPTGGAAAVPQRMNVTTPKQVPGSLEIYTDGACSGEGTKGNFSGNGGYSVIVGNAAYWGHEAATTGNKMELKAILLALDYILNAHSDGRKVIVFSDSKYCVDGLNSWVDGWKKKGWKKSDGGPVKNQDMWEIASELKTKLKSAGKHFSLVHIEAHSGHRGNELADSVAVCSKTLHERSCKCESSLGLTLTRC